MAGYLGTKAVLLSTTAADVVGNAEIGGDLTVGGTVTADGLTVGSASAVATIEGSTNARLYLKDSGAAADLKNIELFTVNGRLEVNAPADDLLTSKSRMMLDSNGDISFYEDTGTTAKFFWDADEEALKIGTTNAQAVNAGSFLSVGSTTGGEILAFRDDAGVAQGDFAGAFLIGNRDSSGAPNHFAGMWADLSDAFGEMDLHFSAGRDTYEAGNSHMTLDASGNLLVGTTTQQPASTSGVEGFSVYSGGQVQASKNGATVARFNRNSSDGDIAQFRKDGSTVGSIGSYAGAYVTIGSGDTGLVFVHGNDTIRPFNPSTGAERDNAIDMGSAGTRFDDIYATNGTIQTSDRNEKQDIEALSDAEQRVAVACKGLLRKFRWKDAVAEKGDDARIHFGIIAQDLQDAFTAEGLDAGRYAMFISSTWWETQTEVPAVEAVAAVEATYDEDGNELTPAVEAVEAKDAYTRTDTYETLEEAPEGATERTRLGVRYPELLAFIIGAM